MVFEILTAVTASMADLRNMTMCNMGKLTKFSELNAASIFRTNQISSEYYSNIFSGNVGDIHIMSKCTALYCITVL
jgi:hypothetical protein